MICFKTDMTSNKYRRSIPAYTLLIVLYAVTSAEMIDLTNGGIDLGRHLKNGELLLSPAASQILHTNFYSYTQPDREFVNHHWLAGIVFHAVYKLGGFRGLNAFYILLGVVTLVLLPSHCGEGGWIGRSIHASVGADAHPAGTRIRAPGNLHTAVGRRVFLALVELS